MHGSDSLTNSGRGQRDPIPRTIRTIEQGFGFGITRAAGALAAVIDVAVQKGDVAPLPNESQAALELLPVALRSGAMGSALAFVRAGARPRAVAHLFARLAGNAPQVDADDLQIWAGRRMSELLDERGDAQLTDAESSLLDAFGRADEIR